MLCLFRFEATTSPDYTTPPCQPQMARLMIIEDLQTNGVIATPADILQAVTVSSFMNLNNRDRFRVLRGNYDCWLVQQRGNTVAAGNQIVPINILRQVQHSGVL